MTVLRVGSGVRLLNGRAYLLSANLSGGTGSGGSGSGSSGGTSVGAGNSAATLISSTAIDAARVFNRDVYSGNPAGFSTTYNKGWATIPFSLTPSTTISTGVWMRLHNAMNSGATAIDGTIASTPGAGVVLQPAVQVGTSLATGANTLNINLPAALAWFYADFALDAAMTHPVRVPVAFGVGHVTGAGPNTSHGWRMFVSETGLGPPEYIEQLVTVTPYGKVYAPYVLGANDPLPNPDLLQRPGDSTSSPYVSAFAAEYLRLMVNQLGVVCALTGHAINGGDTGSWFPAGRDLPRLIKALSHGGTSKWDAHISVCGSNDSWPSGKFSRQTTARRLKTIFDTLQAANGVPNMPVVTCAWGYWTAVNGSSEVRGSYLASRDVEQARSNTIAFDQFDAGLASVNIHLTQSSRVRWAHPWFRYVCGLLGPAKGGFTLNRGPKIVSATRTANVIRCTVQHDQGTSLVKHGWSESTQSNTANSPAPAYTILDPASVLDTDLAKLQIATVYPAGKAYADATFLPMTKITVVDATHFDVYLTTDPDTTGTHGFDLYYGMDLNPPYTWGQGRVLKDDTDQGGVGYGMDVRQTFDPIYVAPANPPAQSVTISPPADTVQGAWIALNGGPGTGLALTGAPSAGVEVSIGGGAYAAPIFLIVKNDNSWSGFAIAPSTIASGVTVAVRRTGQTTPDATTTMNIVSARSALPATSSSAAAAQWDSSNVGTMWQDLARTTPSAHNLPVRVIDDALGTAGNTFKVPALNTLDEQAPYIDIRKNNFWGPQVNGKYPSRNDPSQDRPCLMLEPNTDAAKRGRAFIVSGNASSIPVLGTMQGSFSILLVCQYLDGAGVIGGIYSFSKTAGSPNYSWDHNALNSPCIWAASVSTIYDACMRNDGDPAGQLLSGALKPATMPGQGRRSISIRTYDASTGVFTVTYQNGATATRTNTDLSAITLDTMMLGAAPTTGGSGYPTVTQTHFNELVVFNGVLSSSQQTDLFAYAGAKWPG